MSCVCHAMVSVGKLKRELENTIPKSGWSRKMMLRKHFKKRNRQRHLQKMKAKREVMAELKL